MSVYWGPALDAEIAYRQERVRAEFGRRSRARRGRSTPTPAPSTQARPMDVRATGGPRMAQPAPAIPMQRRTVTERPSPVAGSTGQHKAGRAA